MFFFFAVVLAFVLPAEGFFALTSSSSSATTSRTNIFQLSFAPAVTRGESPLTSRKGQFQLAATIREQLEKDPNFSTFASLLQALPELNEIIANDMLEAGQHTLFAPSNSAFKKLDKDVIIKLGRKDNLPILRKVVRFHFSEELLSKEEVGQKKTLDTLALIPVTIRPTGGGLLGGGPPTSYTIAEASISRPDIACSNGIIHEVDTLISPVLLFRYLV